jgi:hypothetical protein
VPPTPPEVHRAAQWQPCAPALAYNKTGGGTRRTEGTERLLPKDEAHAPLPSKAHRKPPPPPPPTAHVPEKARLFVVVVPPWSQLTDYLVPRGGPSMAPSSNVHQVQV